MLDRLSMVVCEYNEWYLVFIHICIYMFEKRMLCGQLVGVVCMISMGVLCV